MIHYHGLPITPATAAVRAVSGGHAFVSFRHPDQLTIALEVAQSFAVDNGAFSAWRSGKPITDWSMFYEWIAELHRYPNFDFAVIDRHDRMGRYGVSAGEASALRMRSGALDDAIGKMPPVLIKAATIIADGEERAVWEAIKKERVERETERLYEAMPA